MNLLRQRLDKSRFIAFVVISFLIEINEDQTRLNQLSIDLEKLLPLESITLLEGIAFLFKRIAELQTIPYNRRIYDRCIQFLSNRLTPSAIQTAIIILSKLKPSENLGELANVLWSGIKFPNKMIQKMSVKLYFHCLSHFPNSDDLAKGMMSMCSFCIQENANNSETYGAFILIKTFVNHGFEIISEKFGDLFNSLANNLQKSHDYNFFEVFALMCEKYTHKAHEYMNIINDVLLSDWDLNDSRTCNYYVKIANLFPDDFGLLCYNRAQTVNDDSYFKLISVKFGDYSNEAEIIQKFKDSKLTESFINGAYNFLKAYPQYAFRFVPFLVSKTDDCLVSDNFMNAFFLISKFSDAPIFPFQKYWDPIFESLKSSELNIETKKYHVLALLSILHNEPNNQFDKLLDLVFTVQGDSKEVFATLLDNIDDQLLPLFMNDTLQIITSSLSINDSGIAANSIINLFIRLRKLSPLSTFNIFINLLNTLPNSYSQYSSYSEKKKLISTWDLILDGVGDILAPYAQSIYQFSIDLISSKLPLPKTFNDRINYRKIARDNIQIHILAMKCVEKLMKLQYPYDPQKIVDAVLKNLTYFFDESVQIATLNTLRSVFRCFGINKIDLVSLHQKLFNFMKVSKSETVLYSILSILGTIGPLDPITFHMSEKPKELLPLYDKAKREQCYLDFVMRYLLNQLKTSHESSVFLNAILYIFQFDAHKSSRYLSEIMTILEQLLNNGIADSVFHIIRSITLLVEIEIYPYATQIFKLLQPYLINSNFNLPALKALSALVFILKSSFQPIAVSTFSKVLDLMTNPLDFDSNLYLLQILTHLVIFCGCSQRLFFKQITKFAIPSNLICSYALNFLSQVILHTPYEDLSLPSIRLAMDLLKYPNPIKKSAKNLLSILIDKCPIYVPKEVDVTKMNRKANCCEVTSDPFPQRTPPPIRAISVSEVFGKNNFLQYENNWENWLLHISQNLVLCSNSPAIRACHPLMQISTSFEHQLFPLILISVWEISSEKDRNILSNHISTISQNSNTPIELLSIFCDAVEAMDRAGYMLFNNPEIAGRIAVRCENFFRAVRFYERSPSADDNIKCEMIRIHARLQRHESALGIFTLTKKAHRDTSILKELSIWNEARNQYSPHKNESDFIEYIQCCSKLEDWGEIMKYTERFKTLSTESKKSCGTYFGAASTFYNMKDIDLFLPYMSKSTPRHCLWQAIVNIHMGKLKTTRALIERGMKLNASNRAPFLSGNYEPALPSIENATFLEELKDVVDVRENPDMCDRILTLWNSKSAWVKSDVEQLRTLFVVRRLLESNDQPQIGFNFLDVARKLKAWEVYDNSIERFLDSCNDERVKLLKAKVRFDRRQTRDLDEIVDLIKTAADNDTYANAVCAYASRISNPTPELLEMLSTVIHKTPSFNRAWKHWAYGNLYCAQHFEDKKFAVNAMKGFTELIKLNGPYLHYLCQLVSLCFTYETNITDVFADLPPSSIEQIVSQLLSQFDHHNEAVSKSVIQIITKFAENNIQALGFPLSYVEKTGNISPNLADFINCIRKKHPQYMSEIDIVSNGLLEIAVLDIEMINYIIERTILKIDENCEKNVILKEINRMIPYTYKSRGRLKSIFDKKVENQTLANIKKFASEEQEFDARQLRNDLAFLDNQIIKELNKISTIDIAEIAPQMLENTPFSIAVPGMYKANNDGEFPVINSFTKIVKIIPSSKCPKKIRLYGSDGKIYKFLLKGKEDLRIDQRVMQWFSLSNSLLKDDKSGIEKDLSIEGYAVIPLSPLAGMIEWAEGGESFYKLISWYHQIKRPELFTEESNLYDEYAMIGKTHALKHGIINRLEFFRSLCEITNDDALREAIWVKSLCAETWFTQKTNFARSTGLMSIVGYIIGLGDRHPNNILFMNNTGHAVHIDFSECFEKSSKRIIWPEKVPFRLTRMMIKAMGVSGVEGDFKITAQFVMNLMRRNKSALLAFLDIFSKESKTGIYPENFAKVNDKLNGNEFEGENELSVEVQVDRLIAEATNEYNLSQMYIGWKPHW